MMNIRDEKETITVTVLQLKNNDENYKKVVSDVKFYDRNGDLVGIW